MKTEKTESRNITASENRVGEVLERTASAFLPADSGWQAYSDAVAAEFKKATPRRVQPWTELRCSITLGDGTCGKVSSHEACYSFKVKDSPKRDFLTKFIVLRHPRKSNQFWIARSRYHDSAPSEVVPYFWEIESKIYSVGFHARHRFFEGYLWKLVEFSTDGQNDEKCLDVVMEKYFQTFSQSASPLTIDLASFSISTDAGPVVAMSGTTLSEDGKLLVGDINLVACLFALNVITITPDGDLFRVDFEEDPSSLDYDGVVGRLWIDIKNKKAKRREMWVEYPDLAEKFRKEKLNRMKIEWEAGKKDREAKAKAGTDAKAAIEKKAETVDKPKAAE